MLVTGGASGLGAAVVDAVGRRGGTPVVLDLQSPPGDRRGRARRGATWPTRRPRRRRSSRWSPRSGRRRAVVTAAGTDACGTLADVPVDDWERVVAVNLLGTAAVVRAALPHLARSRGRVVTVASTLGLRRVGDATAYCASKFGVVGFTRALAAELAGEVGVTLLVPGGMSTTSSTAGPSSTGPARTPSSTTRPTSPQAVLFALRQPAGCELRELVVASSTEPSWP